MFYYDYAYLSSIGFGVGWLDITDKIKNTTALALTKNITEYWVQENSNYNIKTCCMKDPDQLLHWAEKQGLKYLLVVATGNNLSKNNNLFNILPEYLDSIKNDLTIAGHVLDKGEKFYELHHQCFLVNIEWWVSANRPAIGSEQYSYEWSTTKPIRSEDNWHDGYTPYWIEQGTDITNYTGRRFGWSLIESALSSGKRIYSFNELIRDTKYYIYPEVSDDFHSKISQIYDGIQSYGHFVANTETPPDKIVDKEIQGVVCTAGGITPLICAYISNLKPGSKLTIFDISPLSLAIQRKIRETRCDFKNFKQSFDDFTSSIDIQSMLRAVSNIDKMQEIINTLLPQGLEDFINNVWPTLDVQYREGNLLDVHFIKNATRRHEGESTLIHLTNIMHYQNSAWLYSSGHRLQIEKDLVNNFAKTGFDNYYLYSNRPIRGGNWRAHTPKEILSNTEKYLGMTKDLRILPWINQ